MIISQTELREILETLDRQIFKAENIEEATIVLSMREWSIISDILANKIRVAKY